MTIAVYKCMTCGELFIGTAAVLQMPHHAQTTGHQAYTIIDRQDVAPGDITDLCHIKPRLHNPLQPIDTRICAFYPTAGRTPTT